MSAAHDPDDRIPMTCRDCRREFLALANWQIRCRACYAAFKAAQGDPPAPGRPAETPASKNRVADLEGENATLRRQLADLVADRDRWRRLAQAKPPRAPRKAARIPPEHWRRLVQLAHPDKHGGSEAANAATKWLLEVRP